MKKIPGAYEKIRERDLPDLRSKGTLLRHKKTGARVFLLENEDDNKVFSIGFRTPVENSKGTPHIVEHTVLCGSEKYPIKDPFVELAKGSLNTFLNAMTFPDKTMYPVASTNDKDFRNLMDVYLDAVFHPNIYSHPEIFRQEGWHYELDDPDGELSVNGVVYNEMKGAFSSPDDMLSREILSSLFKDTTYYFESGGDPDVIPDLTYEEFLDFHRRYYHPSNSYIYLYGDMDMNERLDYLDREYLGGYDRLDIDSVIHHQKPYDKIRFSEIEYPLSSEEYDKDRTYLSYNMVVADTLDPYLYQAFDILDYALLSAPGAPVKEALLDAGIGKDILGGYDSGTLQPVFSIIAKDTEPDRQDEFLRIIKDVFREQADGALDHRSLMAAIQSNEFRMREADFGSYPKGLMFGIMAMDSWLYDETDPFLHLDGIRILGELKDRVDTGYFEELIKKYLIDNTHASVVMVRPRLGLTGEREESLRQSLSSYKTSLSSEEIGEIIKESSNLKEYQSTPDTQEDLLKLPMLERSDLDRNIRPIRNKEYEIEGIKIIHHEFDTNGINYIRFLFQLGDVAEELLSPVSLFCRMMSYVNTKEHTYSELANEINLHTGGLSIKPRLFRRDDDTHSLVVEVSTRFLYDEAESALDLVFETISSSDLTDKKRIRELVRREFSSMQMMLMTAGHVMSADRAGSYFSESIKISDYLGGIAYYDFLKAFEEDFDNRADGFISLAEAFTAAIFSPGRLIISTTGDEAALEQVRSGMDRLIRSLPGREEEYTGELTLKDSSGFASDLLRHHGVNEGLKTAAQVQYVTRAGTLRGRGYKYNGAFRVLKTILSYEYFWINIRVKGGAYGSFAQFSRSGDITFSSYRDPNLEDTKNVFEQTADYIENFEVSERDMTKYVIGTVSSMETPLTASANGNRSLTAYMTGITEEKLLQEKAEVLDADVESVRALAAPVRAAMDEGFFCTIGNEANISAAEDLFGEVRAL